MKNYHYESIVCYLLRGFEHSKTRSVGDPYMADLMVVTPALDYCSVSRNSRNTVDDERCHFDGNFDIM